MGGSAGEEELPEGKTGGGSEDAEAVWEGLRSLYGGGGASMSRVDRMKVDVVEEGAGVDQRAASPQLARPPERRVAMLKQEPETLLENHARHLTSNATSGI